MKCVFSFAAGNAVATGPETGPEPGPQPETEPGKFICLV